MRCPPLRRQPDVGIVVEHLPADMAGDAHNSLIALAAFAQLRDRLVPEVVEAKPLQARRLRQAPPGAPPALHGSCRVDAPTFASGKYEVLGFRRTDIAAAIPELPRGNHGIASGVPRAPASVVVLWRRMRRTFSNRSTFFQGSPFSSQPRIVVLRATTAAAVGYEPLRLSPDSIEFLEAGSTRRRPSRRADLRDPVR